MTEKEVVTVIINEVQLHWVTAACSANSCRVSTPSNRRHNHFTCRCCGIYHSRHRSQQITVFPSSCRQHLQMTPLLFRFWLFHGVFAGEMLESDALYPILQTVVQVPPHFRDIKTKQFRPLSVAYRHGKGNTKTPQSDIIISLLL